MDCCSSLTGALAKGKYPFLWWDVVGKCSSDAPAILLGTTDSHCLPSGLGESRKMTLLESVQKQKCLWSNMWHFRGCENAPGLWGGTHLWNPSPLLEAIVVFACRKQEWEAAPTESHCCSWSTGAELELLCCLSVGLHQSRQTLRKAKASQPSLRGAIGQMCHQQPGLQLQGQLSSSKAHCPHEGKGPSCSRSSPSPGIHPGFCGDRSPALTPLREIYGWGVLRKPWG